MKRTRYSLIALAGIAFMSGCKRQEPAAPKLDITASESPHETVTLPVVDPPLDRQAILLAAAQAASNHALGKDDLEAQRKLDGRRFSIRMRFGCGESHANQSRSWTFDPKRRVLSFKVMRDVDLDQLPTAASARRSIEAVEGFWIERPWMLQAGCPRVMERPKAPALSPSPAATGSDEPEKPAEPDRAANEGASGSRQVGIAQFFLDTEARTHRREHRAYETTKVLAADVAPSEEGYDLVIAGRLRRLPEDGVISCRSVRPGTSPSCIVSIQIDNVAIETPGGGETIATWSGA